MEHNFFDAWKRFKKALAQRNSSLRSKQKMDIQLFVTAIEKIQIDLSAWEVKKMFHVEHGAIKVEHNE